MFDKAALLPSSRVGIWAVLISFFLPLYSQAAESGFLPLQSSSQGHISDLVLVYQGGIKRPAWSEAELAPYVTWKKADAVTEQWLFDGFLFIEFQDGRGRDYAAGYGGKPARQTEWLWLLEQNFSPTNALSALDKVVERASTRLGAPSIRRKVILTLPEPINGQKDWGSVSGKALDFSKAADRIAACEWHVDQALSFWRKADFKNLEFAGFYWVAEDALNARDILPSIATAIRKREMRFYWIPYWTAAGAGDWKTVGFDFAWQQPNHFFHPGKVPDSRLGEAIDFARAHGLGLEFEADGRAFTNPEAYEPRFHAYLNAFSQKGVQSGSSVAYYEGGGALLQMALSESPKARELYDTLARWVAKRQLQAAGAARKEQ